MVTATTPNTMKLTTLVMLSAACLTLGANKVGAETHTVEARPTSFSPEVIFIEPGDTVAWENMRSHNTNSMGDEQGLIPAGAEDWVSDMNRDYHRTFETEGVYIYKCDPHYSLGMVGAVIVGEPVNLDKVMKRADGMAQRTASAVQEAVKNRRN